MDSKQKPAISFVVPTKNSIRTIEACLQSICDQGRDDVELISVDNFSNDGTADVSRRLAHKFLQLGPERSAQRNAGLRAASGDIVVFIDSDMVLPTSLAQSILEQFRDPSTEAVVIPESVEGDAFWLRCRNLEKHLYDGDEAVEAARAFRRESALSVGGYDETLTGPEDWELPDRLLRETKGRKGRVEDRILHDEDGLTPWLSFSKKRYYGKGVGTFLGRSQSNAAKRTLRPRLARRALAAFPRQPKLVSGVAVLKMFEFAGVAAGAAPVLVYSKLQRKRLDAVSKPSVS